MDTAAASRIASVVRSASSPHIERNKKNVKRIAYWIATVFVAMVMTSSGILAIRHMPQFMSALAHLGYPPYFSDLLAWGKLAGICVLLLPRLGLLKEWAYVAFGITVLSASYSHFRSGDGLMALEPLVTFAALVVSYSTRPAGRRLQLQAS